MIRIPIHLGLVLTFLGIGGVYRLALAPDGAGVGGPPPGGAALLLCLARAGLGLGCHGRRIASAGRARCRRPLRPAGTIDGSMGTRVLVIDNYDSFVYNLVQELGELGAEPVVHRNDAIDIDGHPGGLARRHPHLTGAGAARGRRHQHGGDRASWPASIPILGVCLGHQAIGQVYGGEVVAAPTLMHGKTSAIHHDGRGVFAGLPEPFVATRYHSLVVEPGHGARRARGDRHHRRRGDHGPAPPDAGRSRASSSTPSRCSPRAGRRLLSNFLAVDRRR